MRAASQFAQSSDEEIMVAYQNGSEIAFAFLYEKHSSRVYGYLLSRLRERSLADDAFQATFLKLHASRAKYDPRLPFAPWLFTICRSASIDALRARKRVETNEVSSGFDGEETEFAAPEAGATELRNPDLTALPSRQREALELRYGQDLSFEEIAKRLEVTPANSRQLISRALRKLRARVQEETAAEETE